MAVVIIQYASAKVWSSVPIGLKDCISLELFKRLHKKHMCNEFLRLKQMSTFIGEHVPSNPLMGCSSQWFDLLT